MNDHEIEVRLHAAGEEFRREVDRPTRAAHVPTRRHGHWFAPALTAVAVVAVALALVVPGRLLHTHRSPVVPAGPTQTLSLPYSGVFSLALDASYVALVIPTADKAPGRIEVRSRADLRRVVLTIGTSYGDGEPSCPAFSGGYVYWTDDQLVPSDLVPGPQGANSVWRANLATGAKERLDAMTAGEAAHAAAHAAETLDAGLGCVQAYGDRVAWTRAGSSIVLLDETGRRTLPLHGQLVALSGYGPVVWSGSDSPGRPVLDIVVGGRVVRSIPDGTWLDASGDRVGWAVDATPHGLPTNTAWMCRLPRCAHATRLGPGGDGPWFVFGSTFVSWLDGDLAAHLARYDGRRVPHLLPGDVFWRARAAFGDTYAYVVGSELAGHGRSILVLQRV